MPYLNVDIDYFEHPKTKRFVRLLGPGAEAMHLKLLAHVGRYHAEDGCLDGYSVKEIEAICGWTFDPDTLIPAMLQVGFLEGISGAYRIHNWLEHQGHIVAFKERSRKANKARWSKIKGESSNKDSLLDSSKDSLEESPILTTLTKLSIPTMTDSMFTELSLVLMGISGYPFKADIDIPLLKEKELDYPSIDIKALLKGWKTYLLDKPLKKTSNPRSQLNNQFELAMKYGKHQKEAAPTPRPPADNSHFEKMQAEEEKRREAR